MNIENWSSTPPTEPGLYPWTAPSGNAWIVRVWRRSDNEMMSQQYNLDGSLNKVCAYLSHLTGHWGPRIDFAPYVPPKPPTIEAWVCEYNGEQRFVMGTNGHYTSYGLAGRWASGPSTKAYYEDAGYTNWEKLDVKVEWAK